MKLSKNLRLNYYRARKPFTLKDIIILSVAIATIIVLLFAFYPSKGQYAEVYRDGKFVAKYSLSVDADYPLDFDFDMVLTIKYGTASVTHSDCKNKICTHVPPISKAGQIIVCAPNRVVIKISGKSNVDAVTS